MYILKILYASRVEIYAFLPSVRLFSVLNFIVIYFSAYKLRTAFNLKYVQNVRGKILKLNHWQHPINHSLNSSTTTTAPQIKMHVNRWALPCAQEVNSLRLCEICCVSRSQTRPESCLTSTGQNSFSGPRPATPHLMSAFEFLW